MLELTPLEIEALGLSLKVALWSMLVSLPFGVAVAWLLGRHEFFGKTLIDGLVHLPLVLPPVVVGYLLLLLLGRQGPLGRSEEHTSELQSLMRISYAVFCLKKKLKQTALYHLLKTIKD